MEHNFTNDITNFVNGMNFAGGTYAQGGLDNAAQQLCGWAVPGVYPYNGGVPGGGQHYQGGRVLYRWLGQYELRYFEHDARRGKLSRDACLLWWLRLS